MNRSLDIIQRRFPPPRALVSSIPRAHRTRARLTRLSASAPLLCRAFRSWACHGQRLRRARKMRSRGAQAFQGGLAFAAAAMEARQDSLRYTCASASAPPPGTRRHAQHISLARASDLRPACCCCGRGFGRCACSCCPLSPVYTDHASSIAPSGRTWMVVGRPGGLGLAACLSAALASA